MLAIRVTEILDHIEQVEPAYHRLRLLICVQDVVASSFQIGAKGESNNAIEKALAKYRKQTESGRSTRTRPNSGATTLR